MKKINGLVLSTLTAAFLVGCGGGGGSSSSSGTTTGSTIGTTTETPISVERGKVYGATVTDANGQVATQKVNSNIYVFATTPIYPITASGGIIDVDNNGIDEGDIELTTPLTSYSTIITPITDYLGDITTNSGKAKLAKLKEITGVTSDDDFLKKVPSELLDDIGTKVLVLTNALFDIMNDGDTTNDDFVSNYTGSVFETKFAELKIEADKYTDKIEMAKALEEKVITNNSNFTKLKIEDLSNTTTSTTLKVSDLTRYVSYDASAWYEDNTVSGDKLSFKPYSYKQSTASTAGEWTLDEVNDYVTMTKDITNPYRFSYVNPITKEEGTFTILSTKKVENYADLYKTKAKRVVTKMATELVWNRWDWTNPTNWDNTTQKSTPITNIDELYTYFNKSINAIVTKESDKVIYTSFDGKEHSYYRLVQENGNYYIESADLDDIGYVYNETIYTGTSLDELIANIKAPAPVFTSDYRTIADENQTGLFFSMNETEAFKATVSNDEFIVFSLWGTESKYFNIDSSGVVTFKTAPDFETKRYYDFYVVATNKVGKKSLQNVQVKINNLEETVTTPTVPITTSFVSGKQLNFNNAQSSGKFFIDGIYEESGLNYNETTKIYESYNCSGLWKDLGNNKIGVTCQDNGTTEVPDGVIDVNSNEITFQFSSNNPTSQDKITVSEYSKSEEVTIDSFNYMNIGVIDSMISGKTITLSDGITYTFNADKTFTTSETGVTPNNWGTSTFLNIKYDNESMKTLVFTETPAVGVIVLENSAANNFSSEVKTITSIQ